MKYFASLVGLATAAISLNTFASPRLFDEGDLGLSSSYHSNKDFRKIARVVAKFRFSDQFNLTEDLSGSVCASSLGNYTSIQTKGSGNVVYVLNQQINQGEVQARCSLSN